MKNEVQEEYEKKQYLSIQQIIELKEYPFSEGQMRHHMLFRKKNGLYKAVFKIGKRVYLRRDLFDKWIESYFCEKMEDD